MLSHFPYRSRDLRLIVYRVIDDHVSIIRLLRGKQDWIPILSSLKP